MSLYQSGWRPAGARREWERTCIGREDAEQAIRRKIALKTDVTVTDAVTWWRDDGSLAVLAADLSTGKRLVMRQGRRGTKVEFAAVPPPSARGEG